jgi:hypothetical protein
MDASKLRNSCICGNTLPYLECCGRFADPLSGPEAEPVSAPRGADGGASPDADASLYHAFRHCLHELSMALFPLRALYQAYWEKLSKEDYPHDMLMEDPEYGRAIIENFFWDHFVQYSDARPILRTARELESRELRLAHDLMQWSYAPLWFYRVQDRKANTARLVNPGNLKSHSLFHGGAIAEGVDGVLTRILPFRGREFCGHTVLGFRDGAGQGGNRLPGGSGMPSAGGSADGAGRMDALFRAGCRELGVKPSVTLRPDVHCDEWRRHGSVFLALWRAEAYDSTVGRPTRGSGTPPVLTVAFPGRQALLSVLESSPEVRASGSGAWDLRFRAMRLARLEAKGGNLSVTLADPAFRAHVRDWLKENLGGMGALPDQRDDQALPGASPESQDMWVHTPLAALNGQTPIQASAHDLGRHRLRMLLREMIDQGRDILSLRRQLGL